MIWIFVCVLSYFVSLLLLIDAIIIKSLGNDFGFIFIPPSLLLFSLYIEKQNKKDDKYVLELLMEMLDGKLISNGNSTKT